MIEYTIPKELRDMPMDARPNLFIPGFAKSGTTALVEYLKQHKDIYIIDNKEPNTLTIDLPPSDFEVAHNNDKKPLWKISAISYSTYKIKYYNNKDKKYRVDASQSFSNINNCINIPLYIKNFSPQAKIILMIREQRQRLISFYLYTKSLTNYYEFDMWLRKISPYIEDFLFYKKIQEYYKIFDSNLLVIPQDSLLHNPQNVMNYIFDFLNLEKININSLSINESIYIENRIISKIINCFECSSRILVDYLNKSTTCEKFIDCMLRPLYSKYRYYLTKFKPTDKTSLYNKLLIQIPSYLQDILIEDYEKTLTYCKQNNLMIDYI